MIFQCHRRQYVALCTAVVFIVLMLLAYISRSSLNGSSTKGVLEPPRFTSDIDRRWFQDSPNLKLRNHSLDRTDHLHTASPELETTTSNSIVATEAKVTLNPLKKFAYLTQTESCLPDYLALPQQLGDPTSCQCDVLVLSWKKKCSNSSLPHVEYIFDPNSTWTPGRNLLYRTIMKREQRYLYYTFLDDDAKLVFKKKQRNSLNPWREYEKSLLQVRPLIGVSWYKDEIHFSKYYNGQCKYPNKTDFLPLTWYDAMFNSFHSEVIRYFLPYYEKMENISSWYSQLYLVMKTDLIFPGQALHHLNVLAKNPLHRPYPQKDFNSDTVCHFLPDLKSEIPARYHKQLEPRFQDWVKNVRQYHDPKYHCPAFPVVRTPMVPFAQL